MKLSLIRQRFEKSIDVIKIFLLPSPANFIIIIFEVRKILSIYAVIMDN